MTLPDRMLLAPDRYPLRLHVNGEACDVVARADTTLLELLREDLRLTGTKLNCEQGECGACTVLVDGRAVDSCLTIALSIPDADVRTIEAIASEAIASDAGLSPVQQAFVDEDAAQCGFCTPGMVMAATALLEQGGPLTRDAILKGLSGNYCRCTGYEPIIRAIESLAHEGRHP